MMTRLEEIVARRQRLVAKSDAARNEMARVYYQYQARTVIARKVTGFLSNPLVLAGLALLTLKMPWRRAYRVGGRAWRLWRLLRTIRRFAT
jgi:hypothetical protein